MQPDLSRSIAILHLSDFHFDDRSHPILDRAGHIVTALQSLFEPFSVLVIIVTGDIAYSGRAEEYGIAAAFFRDLLDRLERALPSVHLHMVFVPGNHDCDLRTQSDIRDFQLLKTRLKTIDPNSDIVTTCTSVQDQYFAFVAGFGQSHERGFDKLARRLEVDVSGICRLGLGLFNTSWLSQRIDKSGELYVPDSVFFSPESVADVEIAAFHHPPNWLDPSNTLSFRQYLQLHYDIALSGHQHNATEYRHETLAGQGQYILEGMAMHDPRAEQNGFNVVLLSPADATWKHNSFVWREGRYAENRPANEWLPFKRNKALQDQGFANKKSFREHLADLGAPFVRGSKIVLLHEVFVYPELIQRDLQRKIEDNKPSSVRIRSNDVRQWMFESKRVLVIGDDKSGRTALAKALYVDFHKNHEAVPLLIRPEHLTGFSRDRARQVLEKAYQEQYDTPLGRFWDLPSDKRVLIVDDFHRCPLQHSNLASFIQHAEFYFDRIIVLVNVAYDIDVLVGGVRTPLFGLYRQYHIGEMGHQLRARVIAKWVALGADQWTPQSDTYKETIEREKTIESLLSRRMLPSYPIIVLGMLQFLDASTNPQSTSGSFGELYQRLITDRLGSVAKKPTDIGSWYVLLSRLAYFMFSSERQSISNTEFRRVYQEYYALYKIHYDVDSLRAMFLDAQILFELDGNISFKYRDFYHFFTAKHISDGMSDPSEMWNLQGRLQYMVDRVYFEEYASVLVFYLYISKDTDVIGKLLTRARAIYCDSPPCNLESHTEFLNRLYISPPGPISLPDDDVQKNREAYREGMDEIDRHAPERDEGEKLPYSDELDDVIKINVALKTMYILGQVLRSFPGVIKQDLKTQIAKESYLLGLRVLTVIIRSVETNADDLRTYFAALIRERRADVLRSQMPRSAEEVILNLVHACAFGIIKRISESVGLAELDVTYDEVLHSTENTLSVRFVDLSIKLDHYYQFPEELVLSLHRAVKKNLFSFSVLRDLIAHYFLLFRSTPTLRQKYCRMFEINSGVAKAITDGLPKPVE
ncbi:MAG: metallophosphoesterase [Bryobacteraceae bacterium]